MKRRHLIGLLGSLALVCRAAPALAQAFPSRPIRLIVGYAPGAQSDLTARLVGQALGQTVGASIVVENRPGANGAIGAGLVARARPDGYTLLLGGNGNLVLAPLLDGNVRYSVVRDFVPIGRVAKVPWVFAVNSRLAASGVAELIAEVRRHPGQFTFAATAASTQLAAERLMAAEGLDFVIVPYKGTAPALLDVAAGRVDMAFSDPAAVMPHVNSGTIRLLAVTARTRSPALPELPTMGEQGIADFAWESWQALVAPAGLPHSVVETLRSGLRQAQNSAEFSSGIARLGFEPIVESADVFMAVLQQEVERYSRLVRVPAPADS